MYTIIVLVGMFLVLASVSGYSLFKRQQWGELVVSSLIWVLAAVYSALVVSEIELINPTNVIINFFDALFSRYFE